MSSYDDRLSEAHDLLRAAHEAIGQLPREQRGVAPVGRLEAVLAYAGTVLAATDGELVSDTALAAVQTHLSRIASQTPQAVARADAFSSELLDAVARFPAARDRDLEQAAKDAASTFQRRQRSASTP